MPAPTNESGQETQPTEEEALLADPFRGRDRRTDDECRQGTLSPRQPPVEEHSFSCVTIGWGLGRQRLPSGGAALAATIAELREQRSSEREDSFAVRTRTLATGKCPRVPRVVFDLGGPLGPYRCMVRTLGTLRCVLSSWPYRCPVRAVSRTGREQGPGLRALFSALPKLSSRTTSAASFLYPRSIGPGHPDHRQVIWSSCWIASRSRLAWASLAREPWRVPGRPSRALQGPGSGPSRAPRTPGSGHLGPGSRSSRGAILAESQDSWQN